MPGLTFIIIDVSSAWHFKYYKEGKGIRPNIEEYLYIYLNSRKFMYNGIKVAFSDTPESEGYQYNT